MDTNEFPVEKLLPRAGGSIYRLVRMAAKRALELSEGKKPLIDNPSSDKVTSIALQEILEGKVECTEAFSVEEENEDSAEDAK